MDPQKIKLILSLFESFFKIAAIIFAGFWSYMLFIKKRQKYPRACVSHKLEQHSITDGKKLLHLTLNVQNCGEVLLSLIEGEVRVLQMLPVNQNLKNQICSGDIPYLKGYKEISWPVIDEFVFNWSKAKREIEPNESDEYHYDFVVDSAVNTVQIYSHLSNERKRVHPIIKWVYKKCRLYGVLTRDIGWNCTTIHILNDEE